MDFHHDRIHVSFWVVLARAGRLVISSGLRISDCYHCINKIDVGRGTGVILVAPLFAQ